MASFILKSGDRTVAGFANCANGSPALAFRPGTGDRMAAPVVDAGGRHDFACRRVGKAE